MMPGRMRALQIVDLSGPDSALALDDLPEPDRTHMLTGREGVVVDVQAAGVSFPEVLQTRGEYQIKPPLPFVPGSEVGGRRAQRAARAPASSPATAWPPSACSAASPRSPSRPTFLTFELPDSARLRAGRGADPQLPHGVLRARARAGASRPARRCSSTAPPGGIGTAALQVAKGLGARTIAVVSSDEKEQVARDGGRRRGRALRRRVEGRGQGALRRRRRPRARPRRRRPLHRQPALAARGGPRRRRRLHRRLDPRGPRQPAAAQQHRGDRRRLGRLRADQARLQPPGRRARSCGWPRRATSARSSARASRSSARARR